MMTVKAAPEVLGETESVTGGSGWIFSCDSGNQILNYLSIITPSTEKHLTTSRPCKKQAATF